MSLNSEMPASPKPRSPPMLKELSPGMGWLPAIPTPALALPMPAQSVGMVWNYTCVNPRSSSLTALEPSVCVQLRAVPRKGELFVPMSWLSSAARSGSDL